MTAFYQIIKHLVLPPAVFLLILLAGFILCLIQFRRLGKAMTGLGILLFYLLSVGPIADSLLRPLESRYSPISAQELPRVGTVVVLGGGVSATPELPVTSRLSQKTTRRILEAVRLYRLMDKPIIVLSGGSGNPFVQVSEAVEMHELLLDLGIPDKRITIEGRSRDTFENAQAIQRLRLKRPLIVVTSAAHMPRTLKVFRALGMEPLPAPCDFRAGTSANHPLRFFPSMQALSASNVAIYEYLGTWWYGLRGRI